MHAASVSFIPSKKDASISRTVADDLKRLHLALPSQVAQWTLSTLRSVKIGARIARHGRYVVFQLAEVAVPQALFAAILRIAEVEGGSRRAAFERFDLSAVAQDIVATMAPIAEESGHELESGIDAPVLVEGDRQLLSQVMFNLIENALRHTAQGTRVRVGLMASGAQAILTVQDNGAGVPPDERDTALRRFGRLDGSRNSSGHGLGLPLVAAIARLHGGGLELGDAEPGLIAKIWLPLA